MSERRGRALNRAELADFTGRSLPTIDAWIRAGCPFDKRGSKGKGWIFNSADVLDWLESRAAEKATEGIPKGDLDPGQERARKDRALAIQTEMKNDLARGDVVSIEVVCTQVAQLLSVVRLKFLALPARAQMRFNPADPKGLFAILEAEVYEILTELCEPENLETIRDAEHKRAASAARSAAASIQSRDGLDPERRHPAKQGAAGRGGRPRASARE